MQSSQLETINTSAKTTDFEKGFGSAWSSMGSAGYNSATWDFALDTLFSLGEIIGPIFFMLIGGNRNCALGQFGIVHRKRILAYIHMK